MYLLGAYFKKSRKGGTIHSFEIIVHKIVLLPALLGVKYTKIKYVRVHLNKIIFDYYLHFLLISHLYCIWLFMVWYFTKTKDTNWMFFYVHFSQKYYFAYNRFYRTMYGCSWCISFFSKWNRNINKIKENHRKHLYT